MIRRSGILVFIVCMFAILVWRARPVPIRSISGQAMGCGWTLNWRGAAADASVLHHEVSRTLEHWEQVMSTWRADSDLSRFNHGTPASVDLQRVIQMADDIRQQSDGAFDPRLLEFVHEAGFAPAGKGLDLSGIGKGFAADRVGERLRELGVNDFLFQLAGDTLAGDEPWEVGIEAPEPSSRRVTKKVKLQKQGLTTSGNYRQFRRTEQGIVSHIIDPRSRKPVIRPFSSVSVIAGDCASADAWATAIYVLGKGHHPASLRVIWQE